MRVSRRTAGRPRGRSPPNAHPRPTDRYRRHHQAIQPLSCLLVAALSCDDAHTIASSHRMQLAAEGGSVQPLALTMCLSRSRSDVGALTAGWGGW